MTCFNLLGLFLKIKSENNSLELGTLSGIWSFMTDIEHRLGKSLLFGSLTTLGFH